MVCKKPPMPVRKLAEPVKPMGVSLQTYQRNIFFLRKLSLKSKFFLFNTQIRVAFNFLYQFFYQPYRKAIRNTVSVRKVITKFIGRKLAIDFISSFKMLSKQNIHTTCFIQICNAYVNKLQFFEWNCSGHNNELLHEI